MTEFLHKVVAKRESQQTDPWAIAIRADDQVRYSSDRVPTASAIESLLEWLSENQREEDNADSQNN